jgi:hypothetical protein
MHVVSFVLLTIKWRLTTRLAVSDCLTKHNLVDVCDLTVLIFADNL